MKITLKILKWVGIVLISLAFLLFMVYILGPRPKMESIDNQAKDIPSKSLTEIEAELKWSLVAPGMHRRPGTGHSRIVNRNRHGRV